LKRLDKTGYITYIETYDHTLTLTKRLEKMKSLKKIEKTKMSKMSKRRGRP